MRMYEHTVIARQDTSESQLNQIKDKYLNLIEKYEGKIVKSENWGLLNLSYIIKKNKKGNYIHFKIEGNEKMIAELEKSAKLDNNLLRFLTVKVKKFDLETNFFGSNDESKNEK